MKFLHYINNIIMLCCFTVITCSSHILMVSKEHKLQLSTNTAHTWSPYSIHSDAIDFFDAIYDNLYSTLYIVGYHPEKNRFVVLSSQDGQSFATEFIDIPTRPIDLSAGDRIDFMKVRVSSTLINVFGRVYYKNKLPENTYANFYLARKRSSAHPPGTDSHWRDEKALILKSSDLFTSQSTILDILTCQFLNKTLGKPQDRDILYFVNDPHMMHTYPFYRSDSGSSYYISTEQGHFVMPTPNTKLFSASKIASQCNLYPTLHKNPIDNAVMLFGGGLTAFRAKKIHGRMDVIKNKLYKSFGTTHFSTEHFPLQLFFLVEQKNHKNDYHPTATLAYTANSLTLSDTPANMDTTDFNIESTQYLDESLLAGLKKEQVVQALEENAFSRFIEIDGQYLFFLSHDSRSYGQLSLTLKSSNGKHWELLPQQTLLPKTVRTIILIPNYFPSILP